LEVQGFVKDSMPQLSLRWHEGMNPEIWRRAMEIIGDGAVFPVLYNDDVNVAAVADAFRVTIEEAEQYFPYGCGEYLIDHRGVGSPDGAINLAKVLNTVLHGGIVPLAGARKGLAMPGLPQFDSFDELKHAFARHVHHTVGALADAQDLIYRITGEGAAFPFLSLLYDDCIKRARPLLAGGVRYRGGTLEVFGANTAADSLVAIKKLVYEEKRFSPAHLLAALDADFEGYEDVQQALKSAPKFGNDDTEADTMSLWVHEVVCRSCRQQRLYTGLDSFLAVMINNGDSVTLGKGTAATADGRKATMPLSNGNQPSAGCDTNGITALLTSMSRLDPAMHAGAVHNLKLSRRTFREHGRKVDALLKGYFRRGGTQLMISVADRDELEHALEHPEEHANLLVRVGGYSERFVNLPRDIQLEVIRRTLY
jgi:pyruvate-formate lyase